MIATEIALVAILGTMCMSSTVANVYLIKTLVKKDKGGLPGGAFPIMIPPELLGAAGMAPRKEPTPDGDIHSDSHMYR